MLGLVKGDEGQSRLNIYHNDNDNSSLETSVIEQLSGYRDINSL